MLNNYKEFAKRAECDIIYRFNLYHLNILVYMKKSKTNKKTPDKKLEAVVFKNWKNLDWTKKLLAVFLVVLVLGLGTGGYYWYTGVVREQQMSQENLRNSAMEDMTSKYNELKASYVVLNTDYSELADAVKSEYKRCYDFVGQMEGNFTTFEYCKTYMSWADGLTVMQK